jgi:outer membrane protein assembly factor BamD
MRTLAAQFLLCLFLGLVALPAATVEELEQAAQESRASELFNAAQRFSLRGSPGTALEKYQLLMKHHGTSRWAGAAQWEIVKLYKENHEFVDAFDACQLLVDHFPPYFTVAIQQQYEIAQAILAQHARQETTPDAQKPKTLPTPADAASMLRIIAKNAPHHPNVVEAQYLQAIGMERAGKAQAAREEHELFLEQHGTHSLADDAAFQIAYIDLKQWRKMKSAAANLRDKAKTSLVYFLARFPQSDKAAQAYNELLSLREAEKRELMDLGEYYEKQQQPQSAAVYFRDLVRRYPDMAELPGLAEKLAQWAELYPEPKLDAEPQVAAAVPPLMPADYTPVKYPLLPVP